MTTTEHVQGSMAQMARDGHQHVIIKMGTLTFLMPLQLCKEEDLMDLDQLPGLQLYGNTMMHKEMDPAQLIAHLKREHPTEDFTNAEAGMTMAEIKGTMGKYLANITVRMQSPIAPNPDPVLSEAELRQQQEDPLPTRTWEITSPHDESDPMALILELESDQRASRDNSGLVIDEHVQTATQLTPIFELPLSDDPEAQQTMSVKEKRNERRRKRRRELRQQRLQEALSQASSALTTPTVSASSQEEPNSHDEDSEQNVATLPLSKVRRTAAGTPEGDPSQQEEVQKSEVQAHMPSMNRETYRRLPVDKSIISQIANRRAIHKFFMCNEKWAFDCAKHLDNAKAELARLAELIIRRTTSTSMSYGPIFTSVEKF